MYETNLHSENGNMLGEGNTFHWLDLLQKHLILEKLRSANKFAKQE